MLEITPQSLNKAEACCCGQSQNVYDLVLFLDFTAYYSFSRTVTEIDNNFLSEDPENMGRKCFKQSSPLWPFSRYTLTSYHFYKLKQT